MPRGSDQPPEEGAGADAETRRLRERLAFAEALIDGTAEGQIAYDLDLRYTAWNKATEALTGLSAEQVLGHTPSELFSAREAAAIEKNVRRCLETGIPTSKDFPMDIEATGRHLWMMGSYRPFLDPEGRIIGVIDSIRDITDRHAAEDALRESQEQLQALFDGMADAVVITDLEGRFLEANEAACERFGWTRDQFTAQSVADVTAAEERYTIPAGVAQAQSGGPQIVATVHVAGDGRRIPTEVLARRIAFRGKPAVLSVLRDITERRRAAEALTRSEGLMRTAMDAMLEGVGVLSSVRDESGGIVDFLIEYANPAIGEISHVPHADQMGRRLLELFPAHRTNGLFDAHVKVVEGGVPLLTRDLHYVDADAAGGPLDQILDQRVAKLGDGYILSVRDVTEPELLRRESERLAQIISEAVDGIVVTDRNLCIVYSNPAFARSIGRRQVDLTGLGILDATAATLDEAARQSLRRIAASGQPWSGEIDWTRPDGTPGRSEIRITPRYAPDGAIESHVTTTRDVTARYRAEQERTTLEEQLRQSQKMEGIGRLAGGIAHDFNNLLTAIKGYASLTLGEIEADNPARADLEQIEEQTDRAAALTRQLLAFARQTIYLPQPVDLGAVVTRMEPMLGRLLGEQVAVRTRLSRTPTWAMADTTGIEQVLLNLVVNASDAMPEGGSLTIETSVRREPMDSQPSAVLSVTDTGVGMEADVLGRLFEPFFTTKVPGKGTGLGLATAYGIVRQAGGTINVTSELGRGSTFRVLLPLISPPVVFDRVPVAPARTTTTKGMVLLVEDDDAVRRLTARFLERAGHTVIACANGAIAVEAGRSSDFDLLITDMRMPGMNGRRVAALLAPIRPGRPVIYISGHTDESILRDGLREPGSHFLAKPFSSEQLLDAVDSALRGPRA
jgi:two-component system, cell cycle sensor histidine kinase and response regulator CckA